MRASISSARRLAKVLAETVAQLDLVQPMVAPHQDHHQAAVLGDHGHGLEQRARRHAERLGDVGNGRQARRRHLAGLVQRRRQLHRLGLARRDLQVGGVSGRERDVVLARRAGRHVLVGTDAAHHPDVRLDLVPVQCAAVEDLRVGTAEQLVARVEAGLVPVEGVGVLHLELARPEHARARACLVPLLDLDVVEQERKVAVGAHLARDVERQALLVRQRQNMGRALAVVELEQLVDLVAAGLLPDLGRLEDRHEQLLRADGVHLLADDLLDRGVDPVAGREPGPETGAQLADHPGSGEQAVGHRFGVGRVVAERRQEVGGEARHGAATI